MTTTDGDVSLPCVGCAELAACDSIDWRHFFVCEDCIEQFLDAGTFKNFMLPNGKTFLDYISDVREFAGTCIKAGHVEFEIRREGLLIKDMQS